MVEFLNQRVDPPKLWQEFEEFCADLWGQILNDEYTQMHGRTRQPQYGVDVFGQKNGNGDWVGIQCKGKDARYGKEVSGDELKAEVEKAKNFKPPIKEFILATTAQTDAKIQKVARKITEAHKKKKLFRVVVLGWGEIQRQLSGYPDLIEKYYPNHGPINQKILRALENSGERQFTMEEKIDQIHERLFISGEGREKSGLSPGILSDLGDTPTSADSAINDEIDRYRDLLSNYQPRTALNLLEDLKGRCWKNITDPTRFRILTNIACAHLKLGDNKTASMRFLEAESFSPNDEKAICNSGIAYLLIGEQSKVKEKALEAIKLHPKGEQANSLLIAASIDDEEIQKPESLIPKQLLETSHITHVISDFYQQRGNTEEVKKWITRAYEIDPSSIDIRISYIATLLESVFNDQSALLGQQRSEELQENILLAAELGRGVWEELKTSESKTQIIPAAINLISAERLLGNYCNAMEVVENALRCVPDSLDLKQKKAVLLIESENPNGACDVLETVDLEKDPNLVLLYAEALSQSERIDDALKHVDAFLHKESKNEMTLRATGLKLEIIAKTGDFRRTEEAIEEAVKFFPRDISVRVIAAKVFRKYGKSDEALEQVNIAKDLLTPDSEYIEKLLIADALFDLEKDEEASVLYKELVHEYSNSQPLRRLLTCLYESGQRREILEILKKVPDKTRQLSFFRRMAAAINIKIGDLASARSEIEKYLDLEPNDLNVRINWIGILRRQGDTEAVESFLNEATDYPKATPDDRMILAQLFNQSGYYEKALELAYKVRIENPINANVHLRYLGLIQFGEVLKHHKEPENIENGTVFIIEDSKGRQNTYFLSDDHTNDPSKGQISPVHPIAIAALGRKVGDIISVPINPIQKTDYKIIEIKSKYIYLFQKTRDEFSHRFPDRQDFMSLSLESPEGEGYCFDPIFSSLSRYTDYVHKVLAEYKSQPFSIGIIARKLGKHPLEIWRGFQADPNIKIFCCDGTHPKRGMAIASINENKNGFMVDPLTLFNIFTWGIQEFVTATIGKLGITQSALDLFRSQIDELQIPEKMTGYGILSQEGGRPIWENVSKESIQSDIEKLENICNWATENCVILPAVGNEESSPIARKFTNLMDSAFTDSILAAKGSGRKLLSDDQRLRDFAKTLWDVDGVWLQAVLIVAADRNLIPPDKYCDATASLIEVGMHFTTISHKVLIRLALIDGWVVSDRYKKVISTLGGDKSDWESSLEVGFNFLNFIWLNSLPLSAPERFTTCLINAITNNGCSPEIDYILYGLIVKGKFFPVPKRDDYLLTIKKWCQGHFIPIPKIE